jgi:hypothetical protein
MFIWRLLSNAVTIIAFAIRGLLEGQPPEREHRTVDVDCLDPECPNGGRTFLVRGRQTACCASRQWVPAGKVLSRHLADAPASEIVFH